MLTFEPMGNVNNCNKERDGWSQYYLWDVIILELDQPFVMMTYFCFVTHDANK